MCEIYKKSAGAKRAKLLKYAKNTDFWRNLASPEAFLGEVNVF